MHDAAVLERLRDGDESAFAELVDRYGGRMLRVARLYVSSDAVAEEVVQETWVRVLDGLDGYEGRSSLRTWLFAIHVNCARRRAQREARSTPLASLAAAEDEPSVSPERFFPSSHPRWAGMWTTLVDTWDTVPDEVLLGEEARERLAAALADLPPRAALVFSLRDIDGWPADEVCELLELTPANQRVLLHRARTRIRAALEEYFGVDL